VGDLLVLWDVDYTLVSADGLGTRLYEVVFREMFGRELTTVAPKAGRTDRAIILDTLALAGVASPVDQVDGFLAALGQLSASGAVRADVRAMAGAAAAIDELALIGVRQSVLTGNIRPLAALKLRLAELGSRHLDLAVGAYGDVHEVRAELVPVARLAAGRAYGTDFPGCSTVLVGDTPLDMEAALATGARAVGVTTGSYSAASLAAAGAHIVLPDLTDAGLVLAAVTGLALVLCGAPCRSAAGRREQAALDRGGDRRGAVGHAKLAEGAQQVGLDCRLADEQLAADLGVGAAARHPGEDLGFPGG
jgi:phosphoglycolate phosphatase-like HAD superfamily hydrolase